MPLNKETETDKITKEKNQPTNQPTISLLENDKNF